MNDVTTQEPRPPKASLVSGGAVAAIVPRNIEEAFRLSEAFHLSGMAPYGLDQPQKILIAMLAGLELGLPPMTSVQSIAVINNRPCMWGDALIGVVRNNPLCSYVKEWIEGDGDSRVAYCETLRKGEADPVRRQFSVDDAKRAGLWQNTARVTKPAKGGGTYEKDNDSPWYRYPQRMLQMRARAWCLRDVYADVLKGMQVREEVEDYKHAGPENAKDVTPSRPSLSERLKGAANETEQSEGKQEGFSAAFERDETETAPTTEFAGFSDDSPSDQPSINEAPDDGFGETISEARHAGREAAGKGLQRDACPSKFRKDETMKADWETGFDEAKGGDA